MVCPTSRIFKRYSCIVERVVLEKIYTCQYYVRVAFLTFNVNIYHDTIYHPTYRVMSVSSWRLKITRQINCDSWLAKRVCLSSGLFSSQTVHGLYLRDCRLVG